MCKARIQFFLPLVALALLFFSCEQKSAADAASEAGTTAASGPAIVHIVSDSLQAGYIALAKELTRLEENLKAAEENLSKEANALQREVSTLQNKAQQGLLSPNAIQTEQARIARKEQEILQKRDIALGSIQQEQVAIQAKFSQQVKTILEDLRKENGYDYVLNQGPGTGVLATNPEKDITDLVLERLNALGEDALSATPVEE